MASNASCSLDSFHFGFAQNDNGLSNNAQKDNLNKNLAKYAGCTGGKKVTGKARYKISLLQVEEQHRLPSARCCCRAPVGAVPLMSPFPGDGEDPAAIPHFKPQPNAFPSSARPDNRRNARGRCPGAGLGVPGLRGSAASSPRPHRQACTALVLHFKFRP